MKALLKIFPLLICITASQAIVQNTSAQKTDDKTIAVKKMIDSQQYVFHAQYATPMTGRQRYLTSDYTVYVSKDSIISNLPYFGRAFSAPVNPSDGGIQFTSTSFEYQLTPRKKGGWNVVIQTKDIGVPQRFNLTVFDNGSASLQVTGNNRQPISFSGVVRKK